MSSELAPRAVRAVRASFDATCTRRCKQGPEAAVRRLSSFIVSYVARHMTPDIAAAIARECSRCAVAMRAAGADKSSVIKINVPPGTVVRGAFILTDRSGAYLDELRRMDEFPEVKRVFTNVCGVLSSAVSAMQQAGYAEAEHGLNEDMLALFGADVDADDRRRHLKSLYKLVYGKLGNAATADCQMPDPVARALKSACELTRRRNALVMLGHAARFGDKCLAVYTDSMLLRGVDAASVVRTMTAPFETWHVEFQGDLAVIGTTNKHMFADTSTGTSMVRPAQMFGTELQSTGWSEDVLRRLRDDIVSAAAAGDEAALRGIRARIPAKLSMPNAAGVLGDREPSVRHLLSHVLERMTAGACSVATEPGSKSSGQRFFSSLSQAETAQNISLQNALVVGVDFQGGSKQYRKFVLVNPESLCRECFGKPCHLIYCGTNLAYRAHLDWDESTPLSDESVQRAADALRQYWQEKKCLAVTVQALRTHTHRDGDKRHAEHVTFLAHNEAGEECVFLNVTEIPSALNLDDSFDLGIYGHRKSLRMPGCPKLSGGMDTAHVPRGESPEWNPTEEDYRKWCPCVCVDDSMVVHCDAPPPAPGASTHAEGTEILFPSERAMLDGLWDYVRSLCPQHTCTDPKMRFFELNQEYNQFLINMVARWNNKYLDFDDFMRRVVVPRLHSGEVEVPRTVDCNHRSGNNSYFLLNFDLGTGRLASLRGKTHMPKGERDERDERGGSPSKRRKKAFKLPNRGTVLELTKPVLQRMLRGDAAQKYARLQRAERDECVCVTQLKPNLECIIFPEDDEMTPLRMRQMLMMRHRALERRRAGNPIPEETREGSHQRATASVSFLVELGDAELAGRAIATERQFYTTHYADAEFTRRVVHFLDAQQSILDSRTREPETYKQTSPWAAVLLFARRYTYKHEIY